MENSNKDLDKKNEEKISQAFEAFNRGTIKQISTPFNQQASSNVTGNNSDSANDKVLNNAFAQLPSEKPKDDFFASFKTELKNLFNDDKKA